jgi:hypothetical protein
VYVDYDNILGGRLLTVKENTKVYYLLERRLEKK